MPSIYDIKPHFQRLLMPVLSAMRSIGLTPNHITILALLLSLASGGAIYYWGPEALWPVQILPAVLFLRMALNALDGMMAKHFEMASPLGAMLNELGDVISDAAIYLPLALIGLYEPLPIILFAFLATISETTGIIGVQIGASRQYQGPMGKSDRAFLIGAIGLSAIWTGFLLDHLALILWIANGLLVFTIYRRAVNALKEVRDAA